MSDVASRRFVLGCTFAVLIVMLLLHFVPRCPFAGTTDSGAGPGGAGLAGPAGPFTIEGSTIEPLSPGVRAPLDVRLTNPHDFPMSVADLRVRLQKVSAPNANDAHPCAVGDFAVDQASSGIEITVAARATSTISSLGIPRAKQPHVGMLNRPANQDGCKGASLTLAYTATGTLEQ
jgi:hypothetical protein